jgi:phage terminase small subunit
MHELQKRAIDPASIGVPNLIAYSNAYARYVSCVRLAKHSQLIVRGYDGSGLYNPIFDKLEAARRDLAGIIIKLDLVTETTGIRQPDDPALSAAPFGYAADM